ncbi:MAG: hypothetical protein GF398_16945 [Chitinivibrionales bacterium]|nr:hypothetical protein [Chitinivibrionales bacterium]
MQAQSHPGPILLIVALIVASCDADATFHRLEAGGLFSFNAYNGIIDVTLNEEVSFLPIEPVAFTLGGEQELHNTSFNSVLYLGAQYRFRIGKFTLPAGILFGLKTIRIGAMQDRYSLLGLDSGVFYALARQASLRLRYRFSTVLASNISLRHQVLIGLAFSLWESRRSHGS